MLLSHFNLRDQPFGVTPDPRYFFPIKTHREALAGLLYGVESGLGFIALTAGPGMGKTTLLRMALDRWDNTVKSVFLFQVITDPAELFRALLIELGEEDTSGTLIELEMRLNDALVKHSESGGRLVIILDEAQNLSDSVLEAMRMLSNFETPRHKLLQVIFCGQQQLADRLAKPELMQLRQRISIFNTLEPLTRPETAGYIEHRLKVAGYESSTPLFTPEAVSLIAHYSEGIPRNINNICFNALSFGCASGKKVIDATVVREAIAGLGLEGSGSAEPIDDLGVQGSTLAEPIVEPSVQGAKFAETSDDVGWQGANFGEPFRGSETHGYELEDSEFSEQRETSPGLRIALIAAVLVATALAIVGWNVSRSGGPLSQPISQVTSWFHNSPPVKNQPQVQTPALPQAPASPPLDQPAQATAPSQDDSPLRSAPAPETKPANAPTAPEHPVLPAPKPNKERSVAKFQTPRKTIPNGRVQVVGARQGQSFAGICVQRFNGCTTALLNTIVELNPDIKDHDHLKAGQQVVLPSIESLPR